MPGFAVSNAAFIAVKASVRDDAALIRTVPARGTRLAPLPELHPATRRERARSAAGTAPNAAAGRDSPPDLAATARRRHLDDDLRRLHDAHGTVAHLEVQLVDRL